jgi:hypothetical protein
LRGGLFQRLGIRAQNATVPASLREEDQVMAGFAQEGRRQGKLNGLLGAGLELRNSRHRSGD